MCVCVDIYFKKVFIGNHVLKKISFTLGGTLQGLTSVVSYITITSIKIYWETVSSIYINNQCHIFLPIKDAAGFC